MENNKKKDINYLIERYPKIFVDYEGNPERVNWYCPVGWIDIVDNALGIMQQHIDSVNNWAIRKSEAYKLIEQVTCTQIKEKFGGLRFYYEGGDDFCVGIVRFIENHSYNICESCGTNQDIGYTEGWISTVCRKCSENYKNTWKQKNIENGSIS